MGDVLYTWGYTGSTPADLTRYMDALGATLIDIRYRRRSRVAHWQAWALRELVGPGRYRGIEEFGNVNYRAGGPIKLWLPKTGVAEIRPYIERGPCTLLCACADVETCHRKVAADLVAEALGLEVVHLPGRFNAWPGGWVA